MLIHIGYHKTGTTFLQSGLFGQAEAGFASPWTHHDIRRSIVLCSEFEWDAPAVRAHFLPGCETAKSHGLVPVMSDERLSGAPHAGGYDSAHTARRLCELFPDARILIGIREQVDAIHSTYQQYVRNGGSATVAKYLLPRHHAEIPQFRFEHWKYHHLIALYQKLFTPERVLVLAYEQLRAESDAWGPQIQRFIGTAPVPAQPGRRYQSLSPAGIEIKRHANRFLFRGALNPAAPLYVRNLESRFERIDRVWPDRISAHIKQKTFAAVSSATANMYEQSNSETARLTGLDLQAHGYAINA